jgi:hypothetical protein
MTSAETDWAAQYSAVLDALESLLGGQPAAVADAVVPATPDWTVRQAVAHLAGTAADATTGRMDGAPGEEWTARHVGERDAATVAELLAELRATQSAAEAIAPAANAMVFNAIVHEADLAEALGTRQSAALWLPVVEATRPRWSRLPLRLTSDPVPEDPSESVAVDGYLLSRALFSRLSRAQVSALTCGALTDEQIDGLGFFGPPAG